MNAADIIRPFLFAADAEQPHLKQINTKSSCFQLLVITKEKAGPEWAFIGKTATMDGDGKYTPGGFVAFTAELKREDGERQTVQIVAVSMDALWHLPTMRQVKVIVNSTDGEPGGEGKPARMEPYEIERVKDGQTQYRWHNPPVTLDGRLATATPSPMPLPTPQPKPLEFPPRDLVGQFFAALNQKYRERGAANRVLLTDSERDPLYINNEGIFVWVSEYVRHFLTEQVNRPVLERHNAATAAVLADIDKVR